MRKHLLIAATAAVVSLPSFANSPYVAVELAGGAYNTSVSEAEDQTIADKLDNAGALAIKAGAYLNDNVRVYGYLQYNGESELTYTNPFGGDQAKFNLEGYQFGAGSDYVYHLNNNFYLLAGGSVGFYQSELETSVTLSGFGTGTTTSKNSGLTYGLNAGMGYMFTDHFGMEAGYRFNYYSGNEHKIGNEPLAKFNSSNQGYINATYKF
ncbi:outer membrane beta-barrel protein [Vibrio brasiliensis]|uniref:outer membrane beta-barrel protein n=1 Tax=Vibrio brasiliensis TaxID=170652 RepID=UPI001EFDB562|nr:outer membrane beta-barrel protein [Vibrio brasiliensis]MCG9649853.1 porin family protein [Vibrio brasiliensis]MCG9726014.1 porin family protein [Vibrio brasiliensis]